MIYVIHNEDGFYLPNDKCGYWTRTIKNAKKYVSKHAMLQRLGKMMKESPNEIFYYETFDLVSKGSMTLQVHQRNEKIKQITGKKKKTRERNGPF